MKFILAPLFLLVSFLSMAQTGSTAGNEEIIYGHKEGLALSMVKVSPSATSNNKAIISVVSGNWVSSYRGVERRVKSAETYTSRGYTVFVVMHGSQPRFTVDEEINDLKRAVRFIRYHAKDYNIDPDHIGITGSSSGGHLSLMVGLSDTPKDSVSSDPVDQLSSRVQAVAVFFPPTDFLNWGFKNFAPMNNEAMMVRFGVAGAFDFKTWDASKQAYVPLTKEEKADKAKELSPIYAVTKDDPPVFIIHGNKDQVVPLQQSQTLIEKLKETGVKNEFVLKDGGAHGWPDFAEDEKKFADWFDKYLK